MPPGDDGGDGPELSERGIIAGVKAGHTYAKLWGNDGPDVRLCAGSLGADGVCSLRPDPAEKVMGDTVRALSTTLTARVTGAGPGAVRTGAYLLGIVKDGVPIAVLPIAQDDQSYRLPVVGPGRYRAEVLRTATGLASIEDVTSPIYLQP